MTITQFRSRKLFLIMSFILMDSSYYDNGPLVSVPISTSIENSTIQDNQINEDLVGGVVWIMNEIENTCLGAHGFSSCGDLNMWRLKDSPTGLTLQTALSSIPTDSAYPEQLCLGHRALSSQLHLLSCDRVIQNLFGFSVYWRYNREIGTFRAVSKYPWSKPRCIHSENSGDILQPCTSAAIPLKVVQLSERYLDTIQSLQLQTIPVIDPSKLQDIGFWQCPTTGHSLSANLDRLIPGPRQVLTGSGIFKKVVFGMTFNVYHIGWYVDVAALQRDPAFKQFKGMSQRELYESSEFQSLMFRPGGFDRTLLIKLAMTLKRDVVIQGLVDELKIKKEYSSMLSEASNSRMEPDLIEGTEILFTWQQANPSKNTKESFIVRTGKESMVFDAPGMAEDFLFQFFREDDPVSEEAKLGYMRNFPFILSGVSYTPTITIAGSAALPSSNPKRFSFTAQFARILGPDHEEVRRMRHWKAHLNSLLINPGMRKAHEEMLINVAVILYCCLLVLMSLPPAMIAKGVRVVARVKRHSIRNIKATIQKTLSRSTSLVNLARSASLEFKSLYESGKYK